MSSGAGALMRAEMAEQPEVLRRFADRRTELAARVAEALPEAPRGIVLVARGSSDHAAIYGRYLLEVATRRPVSFAAPSLHTLYHSTTDYRGYLAIAISQSGRTPEIVTVLQALQRAGATGVAITNTSPSPLQEVADASIDLAAGEERAIPATKTFTAQLAAFAVIAEAVGTPPWGAAEWARLPEAVTEVLDDDAAAAPAAEAVGTATGLIAVARGYLYPIALEAALKLKETTFILAQGYSAADLRHGPIVAVSREVPVVAFDAPGPAGDDIAALRSELEARGARVLRSGVGAGDLPLPAGLPEALVPLPAAVRAQQLARAVALHRGLDPDQPEGLRKVTSTY